MFGFSFRSLAEAAINTFTAPMETDAELDALVTQAKSQESSFSSVLSITKEVEKQILTLADTNSLILRHMEVLDKEASKKDSGVDVWKTASRFYYSMGYIKENLIPELSNCILSIRGEISKRSELLHDLETKVDGYNKKQSDLSDDNERLDKFVLMQQRLTSRDMSDDDYLGKVQNQINQLSDSITKSKEEQEHEKSNLINSLKDLISTNQSFIESSLTQLYGTFTLMYSSMSRTFSSDVPESIQSLKQPLIENQPDKVTHINLTAGSTHDHSISMTKGSYVKWLFSCDDSTVRFSVIFTPSLTKESVMIEEEHKVKGDGRYDIGEYTCEEPGVLTLVWDNTYSLLTSREVTLRIGVKHPKQEVKEVVSEEVKTEEAIPEVDQVEEVKTEELKEEVKEEEKPEETIEVKTEDQKTEELELEESATLEGTQENNTQADSADNTLITEEQ